MLHCMSCFVSGNAHRRYRSRSINGIGQADDLILWVIVIGQIAGYPFNTHMIKAIAVQNHARGVSTGISALVIYRRVLLKLEETIICAQIASKRDGTIKIQ